MAKAASPIPPGFHTVTPHLTIKGGAAAYIDFLKKAFNAVEIARSPGPGGKLMHAHVKIGDSNIMFADDFSAEFHMPPLAEGRLPMHLHIYVADALFNQAVAAGAEVTMPIGDQFWGDRYGQLRDPFGIDWAIGSRQEDLTPAEMQDRKAKLFGGGQ